MTDNQIKISIKAESDKAIAEIEKLNKKVTSLSKTTKQSATDVDVLNKSFLSLSTTFVALAGGIASFQGLQKSITTIADFEEAMKKLKVVSGATEEEFKKLEDTALKIGETTKYSATLAAEGLIFLAMAGFDAEQSITALPDVLNLATVGGLELAEASDIASDSLTAFGLTADDMDKVTDAMAKTITSANTNVSQLGSAFTKVAPVSASLGVSINETAGALGVLADSGIKAEVAGTSLKIALLRLTAPAKTGADAMKQLGVNVFDSTGQFIGLNESMDAIGKSLEGLSEQQKVTIMKDIFGSEALASSQIMIENLETTKARVIELNESNGEAERMAKEMSDTLNTAYKEVLSAIEGVILSSKDELIPMLKDTAKATTEWIRSIDKDAILGFVDGIKLLAGALKDIGSTIAYLNDVAMPDWLAGENATLLGTVADGYAKISQNIRLVTADGTENNKVLEQQGTKLGEVYGKNQALIEQGEATKKSLDERKDATEALIIQNSDLLLKMEAEKIAMKDARVDTDAQTVAIKALEESNKLLKEQYIELNTTRITTKADAKEIVETSEKQEEVNEKLIESTKELKEEEEASFKARQKSQLDYWSARLANSNKVMSILIANEKALKGEIETTKKEIENIQKLRLDAEVANSNTFLKLYKEDFLEFDKQIAFKDEASRLFYEAEKAKNEGDFATSKALYDQRREVLEAFGDKKKELFGEEVTLADEALTLLDKQKRGESELYDLMESAAKSDIENKKQQLSTTQKLIEKEESIKQKIEDIIDMIEKGTYTLKIDTTEAETELQTLEELFSEQSTKVVGLDTKLADSQLITLESEVESEISKTVGLNRDKFDQQLNILEADTEEEVSKTIDLNTTEAFRELSKLESSIIEMKYKPVDLSTTLADTAYDNLNAKLVQTTKSSHIVVPNTVEAQIQISNLRANTDSMHYVGIDASGPLYVIDTLKQNSHSVHYVTVVQTNATGGDVRLPDFYIAKNGNENSRNIPKLATGGGFPKRSGQIFGHDLTGKDDVPTMLTRGEFVQRVKAVDYYGRDFMHSLNSLQIPREILKFNEGGSVDSQRNVNLSLTMPDNNTSFDMMTDEKVAQSLERYLRKMR